MPQKLILDLIKLTSLYQKFNKSGDLGVCVICFHRISDLTDCSYPSMKVEMFENIMKYLIKNFSIIHIHEKNQATKLPKLVITFDDGYKDFIENVLPLLIKYQVKATMNVVVKSVETGLPFWTQRLGAAINRMHDRHEEVKIKIGGEKLNFKLNSRNCETVSLEIFKKLVHLQQDARDEYLYQMVKDEDKKYYPELMNFDDLRTCIKNNVFIGSHSMTHTNLEILRNEDELNYEIQESKSILEEKLGVKVDQFAFPNGFSSPESISILKKAGYKYLFTTTEEYYTPIPADDIQMVPRILIHGNRLTDNILRINLFQSKLKKLFGK